jgi:CRP-like cAMP-binding protein
MVSRARSAETWRLDDAVAGPLIRAAHLGQRRVYQAGEYLYRQGALDSRFHFLLRGRVQIASAREDGSEFVLEVMGRWSVCGEGSAFDGKPRFSSAVALEETEAIAFDAQQMLEAFREMPELAVALLRITGLKQRVLAVRAQYLASPRPESRIAELLHRLGELYGTQEGAASVIGIALTHEQMAAMTGTTRVTVTRVLKRLREQGVIQVRGRQLRILDPSRLMM